jgi:hypothetical protein
MPMRPKCGQVNEDMAPGPDHITAPTCGNGGALGALGGTRTPNLLIRSQMLYPLSYERR